jgi:hypothetical protein
MEQREVCDKQQQQFKRKIYGKQLTNKQTHIFRYAASFSLNMPRRYRAEDKILISDTLSNYYGVYLHPDSLNIAK